MVDIIYFLSYKKVINGRLSIITLEEFNTKLSSAEFINEAKLEILDKFLNMESSKEYMESILNF